MQEATFIRYLAAKRTVDDRALNRRVWDAMISSAGGAPRVLEIGGGIGTMIERIIDDGRLVPRSWSLMDEQPALIAEARKRLPSLPFPLEPVVSDLETYLGSRFLPFDLVIANAVLDLLDPPRILPLMAGLCRPGGLFLFSITFDGLTVLEPEIDRDLDRRIVEQYHATMDERLVGENHRGTADAAGTCSPCFPAAATASSRPVHPTGSCTRARGAIPPMSGSSSPASSTSSRKPSPPAHGLDAGDLDRWLAARRKQLAAGELVFMAHQLDVLAGAPGG